MRQAGRYLPEYRATREEAGSFLALCRTPKLAAEVTLQPIRRFGFDAAIIFSDILLPLSPMGVHFTFPDEGGPRIEKPLTSPVDWARLSQPLGFDDLSFVLEAIGLVRAGLPADVPLIGFCGAPWTLASYLIEGGSSRDHHAVKVAALAHPHEFRSLMVMLGDTMGRYLLEQVRAGAQAVQVFDSWAGTLDATLYRDMVLPAMARLLGHLEQAGVPRIVYLGGAAHLLDVAAELPCEVLGVDWRTDLTRAAEALPGKAVQGNLDPSALLAPAPVVARLTERMMRAAPAQGWIANLGHGILPRTPIESVEAFLRVLRGTA